MFVHVGVHACVCRKVFWNKSSTLKSENLTVLAPSSLPPKSNSYPSLKYLGHKNICISLASPYEMFNKSFLGWVSNFNLLII